MFTDFTVSEKQLRTELRDFFSAELPEDWTGVWRSRPLIGGETPKEVSARLCVEMARRGWLNRLWPSVYGGQDSDVWEQVVIQEECEAHFEPRGGQYFGVNWLGPSIMHYGTEKQKDELLPEIASGSVQWAQLFSESDAGSDLAAVRTSAHLHDEQFIVQGEKLWTSYGCDADRGFLLARSRPGSTGKDGLSVLLIDMDAPGVEVSEIPSTLGHQRICREVFIDAAFPRSCLLGPLHGGWQVAMKSLAFERSGIAGHTRATRILGRLLQRAHDGGVDDEVAPLLAMGRVAELLYYQSVEERDSATPGWINSAVRVFNAWYLQCVADYAESCLGPRARVGWGPGSNSVDGEIEAFVVKRAPVASITAGALEIQSSLIAKRALGLPKSW